MRGAAGSNNAVRPLYETANQGYTLLYLLYAGMLWEALYCLLSPLMRRIGILAHFGMQMLLCVCGVFLCFLALEKTGCDVLRPYMLLSVGCGAMIFRLGIGAILHAVAKLLRNKGKTPTDVE